MTGRRISDLCPIADDFGTGKVTQMDAVHSSGVDLDLGGIL